MRSLFKPLLLAGLILGSIEGFAYWWMHPAASGKDQAVLVYRPENRSQEAEESSIQNSKFKIQTLPPPSVTLLPEIVARSIPSLHCSTGTAARIDRDDGVTIHLAFFEWDLAESSNVLEAYKHLPEVCMGSIGMSLIERCAPRSYKIAGETLSFDHTTFRDQGGAIIHSFKGVWVSGASKLLGPGILTSAEQTRLIRLKAALKRLRPAYARVAQGAVRGILNPDLAWQAFREAMLEDLEMSAAGR